MFLLLTRIYGLRQNNERAKGIPNVTPPPPPPPDSLNETLPVRLWFTGMRFLFGSADFEGGNFFYAPADEVRIWSPQVKGHSSLHIQIGFRAITSKMLDGF